MTSFLPRDGDRSTFTSKTPHFFKVILQETTLDSILGIPTRFVRKYGSQLPTTVKLEVPSGSVWQVELTKRDNKVWLQKGWGEFAEHYSLELGSFVVFRYEKNDLFHVLIFDRSASEIEYACTRTEDANGDVSGGGKRKKIPDLSSPLPQKKTRVHSPEKSGTGRGVTTRSMVRDTELDCRRTRCPSSSSVSKEAELEKHKKKVDFQNLRTELGGKSKCSANNDNGGISGALECPKPDLMSKMKPPNTTEKQRADIRARAFKSANPSFSVVVQPSYVLINCYLNIPKKFGEKYFKQSGEVTLRVSGGRTWVMNYQINAREAKFLKNNWKEFVLENDLKIGDILVFELIKENENLLEVTILPVSDIAMSMKGKEKSNSPCPLGNLKEVKTGAFGCLQHLTSTEKAHAVRIATEKTHAVRNLEIANALKSTGNPVFMVVMRPPFVCNRYRMCIPSDFAKKFLTKHTGDLTLCNSAGKTWPAKYYRRSGNKPSAELYGGWREFVEDNHVGVGDVCIFELIKHPEILMKVIIYSIVENASKSYGQPTHGSMANRVETRSSVSDTEPTCQQSPCLSSSRKFKDPTGACIEILDDSPLNQKAKKRLKSPLT